MSKLEDLITKVEQWADDRNFKGNATLVGQAAKTVEEAQELEDAILKIDDPDLNDINNIDDFMGELKARIFEVADVRDGIGDTLVTLIILCYLMDVELEDCLEYAYNEIKDRDGMWYNGVFVKEAKDG